MHYLFFTFGYPIHHHTVKPLWQQRPMTAPQPPARWDYHAHPDRSHARLQMVRLSDQGWDKVSLSQCFRISRPTVDRWIARFETEHFAGLMDHQRGPTSPRKVWLPVMVAVDSSPQAPSRCRSVSSLESAGAPGPLGAHGRPYDGAQQAGR